MTERRSPDPDSPAASADRFARLHARPGLVIGVIIALTAALIVPFLAMAPTRSASTEPSGDVFTARDRIDEAFVSSVHPMFTIAAHEEGDLLRAEPLAELLAASAALRADVTLGPTLLSYFEAEAAVDAVGVLTLADLVDAELRDGGVAGIAGATDAEVKAAGAALIDRYGERSELLGLSAASARSATGEWIIPAVTFPVLSDNEVLGFGNLSVSLGGDTDVEEFDREVRDLLRSEAPAFRIDGVAIDVNLTAAEQGAVAGPFIGFTILAALVLVGLIFRSYWVLATVGVAFLILIVWLKGISNLIGLEDDLVLSLIVPVAMVSFGVDFAFHAIGRYREERAEGRQAGPAVIGGLTAVIGALVLALTSDAVAFLANVTSGIESIQQFGIGAAIALASAFVLLGVVAPLVVAWIEERVPAPGAGRRAVVGRVAGGFGAAGMAMASVLLLVFILPWLGVVMAAVTALATLAIPFAWARRQDGPVLGAIDQAAGSSAFAAPIGRIVAGLARRPVPVLGIAAVVTVVAAVYAVQVPAEFDVEDFFSSDTDFVVGLDQLDVHVGDRGGEPAIIYVEGDLTDPSALAALSARLDEIRELDSAVLARGDDGLITVDGGVFEVLDASWLSPVMSQIVAAETGVVIADQDADGIPDTREQVVALLGVARSVGVPLDTERLLLTPDDVRTVVSIDGPTPATVLRLGLVDSRAQQSVANAREALEPIVAALSGDLGGSFVQITGSPFEREASLDATNRALQVSLPIAMVLCLVVAGLFLRSVRYGLASIVPIAMVVAWLYAFMFTAGFAINLVTATIAAVSVGIGIDFAIHFIVRYREELARYGGREQAVRVASEGTGLALVASALSSAIGFGILAFAPMPLFAAYGLLTAVMIVMALVATLAVLPSLLVLITSDVESVPDPAPARVESEPQPAN